MKRALAPFAAALAFLCHSAFSAPLHSPTWGFRADLPAGYEYVDGDGKDRFSFENADGAKFDLAVYRTSPDETAPYASPEDLARNVLDKLGAVDGLDSFVYRQKKAYIVELAFSLPEAGGGQSRMSGWALCLELGKNPPGTGQEEGLADPGGTPGPALLALAYGPEAKRDLHVLHFSALDSVAPGEGDRYAPGPIVEYAYPRQTRVQVPLFGLNVNAWMYREDAEAAQAVVDREFQALRRYTDAPNWKEAWSRFYRVIYKDSFERLADAAFQAERKLNAPPKENRDFAQQALQWVQSFAYERDLMGSDFVNLVSAAVEGRGDCDSRSMLWALVLNQANIPAAIMASRHYGHAMGLADLPGPGARFETGGLKLLVAETSARVSIGLIGATVSDPEHWLGIEFE